MDLKSLPGIIVVFVVLAIVLGMGSTILGSVKETQCTDGGFWWNTTDAECYNDSTGVDNVPAATYTIALNATGGGLAGIDEFAGWQTTLAVIVVAAIVIGVIGFFWKRGM